MEVVSGGAEGKANKPTQADNRLVRLLRGKNNTVSETESGTVVVKDREGCPPKPINSPEGS